MRPILAVIAGEMVHKFMIGNRRRIDQMRAHKLLSRPVGLLAVLVAHGLSSTSPVVAQEACIVCTGPDQIYLCSVEKSDKIRKFGAADKAIQFACIKEMAKLGKHDTCRVRRDADPAICNGLPQTVLLGSLLESAEQQEAAAKIALQPAVAKPEPQKLPPGSSPPDAPKTMVELARRANEQSAEQMKQAGSQVQEAGKQVGGAVQKTFMCVITLFQRC
jgi:hypothetical protein